MDDMTNSQHLMIAFLVTLFAGLCTGIGGLIAFFTKTTNKKFFAFALGLSAGVMIYVSLVEILPKSLLMLTDDATVAQSMAVAPDFFVSCCFFIGVMVMLSIDRLVPDDENPHEVHLQEELIAKVPNSAKLHRTGVFMALAVAIHNFPEGFVTFLSVLDSYQTGLLIAFAIAIHNIPEGISISVPIYYATQNRKKALLLSAASGLAEPIGAAVGYGILSSFMTPSVLAGTFAGVAGVMVYISIDELLPAAHEYGEHHMSVYGFILGMFIMAVSLLSVYV